MFDLNNFFGMLFQPIVGNPPVAPPPPNPNNLINLFQGDPDLGVNWLGSAFSSEPPPWAPWHPEFEHRTPEQIERATELQKKGVDISYGNPIPLRAPEPVPQPAPVRTNPYPPLPSGVPGGPVISPEGILQGNEVPDEQSPYWDSSRGAKEPGKPFDYPPIPTRHPQQVVDHVNEALKVLNDPIEYAIDAAFHPIVGVAPVANAKDLSYPILATNGIRSISQVPRAGNSPRSREFGKNVRRDDWGRYSLSHAGLDMPGDVGDPFIAQFKSRVLHNGVGQGYGHYIDLLQENGYVMRIAHLGNLDKGGTQKPWPEYIKEGATVVPGQVLGYVGFSGNATKKFPHAHVEIFPTLKSYQKSLGKYSTQGLGYRVDPRKYFEAVAKGYSGTRARVKAKGPAPLPTRRLTAYSPQAGGSQLEGGYAAARKGPDGHALVRTVSDFVAGDSKYITLAGNPAYYGKRYLIPKLSLKLNGKRYDIENVVGVVHDTGSAFKNAPEGRFDIPLARDLPASVLNNQPWLAQAQFVPLEK
ncbi:MAG: M23 family metallopeptidase [bacterium]